MSTALEEATARCASLWTHHRFTSRCQMVSTFLHHLRIEHTHGNFGLKRMGLLIEMKIRHQQNEHGLLQSLEEQMKGMEREHQRALDDANQQLQHERARATEIENEQLRAQEQRAREREDEQRARDKIEHETEMLRYRLQHVDEVNKLKDELRIATELKPADGTARTRTGMNPAADLAGREAVRIEAAHSSLALNHPQ